MLERCAAIRTIAWFALFGIATIAQAVVLRDDRQVDVTIAKPPQPREDTPFKPTFVVASLSEVRLAVEATGGYLKPDSGAWHFRGHTVLDGWDPEGNIVQFTQPE